MTAEAHSAVWRSTLSQTARAVGWVGVLATGSIALVSDVLAPLADFALLLAIGAGGLLGVVVASRWLPFFDGVGERLFKSYWRVPVALTLAVSAILLLAANWVTRSAPEPGWLGSHVSPLRDLQRGIGVLDAETRAIAATTQGIKKDTETIIAKLDDVKKETSDDPRKELANLGVTWSPESFIVALKAGDARAVELFLQGGMSPTTQHEGASALVYMLQPSLPDPVPMLELMVASGFDVNADVYDALIMRDYGSIPPVFESPLLPNGYIGHGTFEGPALLWLVTRSAYGVTEGWDVRTIEFLKSHGADTKVTRDFLDAMEPAWGDTPTYQRVRAAVIS